jgi:hypothetical protein
MTSWLYSRSCRTASIRSGRAGGLAGELQPLHAHAEFDGYEPVALRPGRAKLSTRPGQADREHANSEVVGIHASWLANRFEALEPVRQGASLLRSHRARGGAWLEAASRS